MLLHLILLFASCADPSDKDTSFSGEDTASLEEEGGTSYPCGIDIINTEYLGAIVPIPPVLGEDGYYHLSEGEIVVEVLMDELGGPEGGDDYVWYSSADGYGIYRLSPSVHVENATDVAVYQGAVECRVTVY